MAKMYKLKVLYGSEACDYAYEHTFIGAIRKVKKGELEGSYNEYLFNSQADAAMAIQILDDAEGWYAHWTKLE